MPPRNDYSELANLIQATMSPLINKIQTIENKVDILSQDRVTRTDLEKLRGEIVGSFVDRASYEARQAALVDRNAATDMSMRELRKDMDADLQKIHDRLESGKQQIEDRIKNIQEAELSARDRAWLRVSQVIGIIALIVSLIGAFIGHIHFS